MPGELYPHIYLNTPPQRHGFTSVQTRGGEPRIPERNRNAHSTRLVSKLEQAWQAAGERQAVVHAERHGNYLEFASAPGFDLVVKRLEARKSGIRLLNVRVFGVGEQAKTLATVYVPSNRSGYFLKKVRTYATEVVRGTDTPKNAPLVRSIDDVRDALLEAFWTDAIHPLPDDQPNWVEVWLSSDTDAVIQGFRDQLQRLTIREHEHRPLIRFPERAVVLVFANREQLAQLIEFSDDIAEFRAARSTVGFFLELENRDQLEWVRKLQSRLNVDATSGVAVCILDGGVNNGHPLLNPVLANQDMHTVQPAWGLADDDGHGTLMAGTAAYGDLQALLESGGPVLVAHVLESAKILPPPPGANPKHLWGHTTAQGVYRAEIQAPDRKRVICMAVTAEDDADRGKPTSWSGAVDALASGADDERKRLLLISGGNVRDPADWGNYPHAHFTKQVHDPAQAWNALTVGGCTFLTRIDDPTLNGYTAIAPAGSLSPFSSTSVAWPHATWPIKPEVVFEGGNVARNGGMIFPPDDLKLLSTCRDTAMAQFESFDGTSAAVAQVAWMAAQVQRQYPQAWPETIRAILVHSARWTGAMRQAFLHGTGKADYQTLLRTCGYGVPDLNRGLYCMRNSLTLVSQAEMQPFHKKDNGSYATNDMHLYRLPWPRDVLLGLAETPVEMRVTLSYFIEPGPGEIGWKDRYRYASHGLRFELNSPGEDEREFLKRINRQQRSEEEDRPDTEAPNDHWTLGQQRNVGSIHSDIWTGRAADLASSHLIGVRPGIGWWRERHHLGKWNKHCRYALAVSIETPQEEMDVYTPVSVLVGVPTPIPIEIRTA